ncbi:MAG TPA: DUF2231 domain-containing protein, partial [Blastocatellia bacterium]|nr:DUF2231 domain-containing protein [Blastocatellia bacterium]
MANLFRVAGHPVYPILFSFSIALFVAGVICDIASLVEKTRTPYWTLSWYAIGGGVAAGLLAAIPGFIDSLSLNQPEVRRLDLWHLLTCWAALV